VNRSCNCWRYSEDISGIGHPVARLIETALMRRVHVGWSLTWSAAEQQRQPAGRAAASSLPEQPYRLLHDL
jgi:hypothetical protein